MLSYVLQGVLTLVVSYFALYALLEARSAWRAVPRNAKQDACPSVPVCGHALPSVSVLLPIYNEKLVVEKLIDAVCALRYPGDKLEILVLDDSTDETFPLAAARIALHRAQGVNVRHARREQRVGHKAGNLNFGLTLAQGRFIAIFDADCLPPPHFLQEVMPHFADPQLGFLQTGIAYANAQSSFLTRFQAAEAQHKEDVTEGLSVKGFMASLTGSSCVWRRSCIDDIGGISAETITEDVDMGYRAQLGTWKYLFPRHVVSLAELPESMGAFRVQRQRWARGLAHNALRHVQRMFAVPMRLVPRMHAVSLMFSSLLLASFYVLLLAALPLAFMMDNLGTFFHVICTLFLLTALLWAWGNMCGGRRTERGRGPIWQQAGDACGYVLMFFPLSLYYFSAAAQVLAGVEGRFHRTPKGVGRAGVSHPPINGVLIWLEVFSFVYATATLAASLLEHNYWVTLYSALGAGGFAMTLYFSWGDRQKARAARVRHVCITGATGALGSALAREYAAPGMRLSLHGRRAVVLEQVAEQCRASGAVVTTYVLDLRQTQAVRQWMEDMCRHGAPDLIIANAGRNASAGPQGQGEDFAETRELVEVNVLSVMALVSGALPALRQRKRGHIAIISSLAAYYGLPATPTYCATKAALKVYGDALRAGLAAQGIEVSVVLPGYVASPMCHAMPGPKPFLWQPERAARVIRRGLERGRARISFPFPLNLGIWGLSVLPACLASPIARMLGYGR